MWAWGMELMFLVYGVRGRSQLELPWLTSAYKYGVSCITLVTSLGGWRWSPIASLKKKKQSFIVIDLVQAIEKFYILLCDPRNGAARFLLLFVSSMLKLIFTNIHHSLGLGPFKDIVFSNCDFSLHIQYSIWHAMPQLSWLNGFASLLSCHFIPHTPTLEVLLTGKQQELCS